MRALRHHRKFMFAFCVVLSGVALLFHFTNVLDLINYALSPGSYVLPLALHCNAGRLGNQMCTYATIYGLSTLNNRRPFVALSCNAKHLQQYFSGLSVKKTYHSFLYLKLNSWKIHPFFEQDAASIPNNSNFIAGYLHPCSYTFFDHVRIEIRREFRFHEDIENLARSILQKANTLRMKNVTYVGIHVRRGDYKKRWLDAFKGVQVNMEFFKEAINYYRNKYNPVVFIAVSNDRLWCIENLAAMFDVYVPEETPSPGHDLAILALCNHTVLTYGTFGFWGAYLAGGEVVYFDKFLKPDTEFTKSRFVFEKMYPPQWRGIVTVNISGWKNISATLTTNVTTIQKD